MSKENALFFGSGIAVGVIGFYTFVKLVVMPKIQKSVEDGVSVRVQRIITDRTGVDASALDGLIRREVSIPISMAVVEAL
jgi:hypothetical protein